MSRMLRRALVVGGSISGLFAALFLRRAGWHVDVVERSQVALTGRGAGIMTHPEIRRSLTELGMDTERDFGVAIERRVALDASGTVVAERRFPQTATSWNRLFEMLAAAFGADHYHLGRDVCAVSQGDGMAVAHFSDGTSQAADLLVAADGFRSSVRGQLVPELQPLYAGYVAWRGLIDERDLVGVLPEGAFDDFVFALPPGEQFLGYPVAGPGNDLRRGHRSWNIVWYRPADVATEVPRLLTDEQGRTHEVSIPPPLIAGAVIEEMRDAARRLLARPLACAVERMKQPFLQPIYDLESPAMAFGRIALTGDAAFVIRPHVGAGVVKAAEDAAALAASLDATTDVPSALRAFEVRRLPEGRAFVRRARRLGSYLKHHFATEEERAAAAFHAAPERVLAETATVDFPRG